MQGKALIAVPTVIFLVGLCVQSILAVEGRSYITDERWQRILIQSALILAAAAVVAFFYPLLIKLVYLRAAIAVLLLFILGIYVATLLFGRTVNGSTGWIKVGSILLQPTEIALPLYILAMAALLNHNRFRGFENWRIGLCIGFTACCMLLILLQNELGGVMVMAFTFAVMAFTYIENRRRLALILLALLALCALLTLLLYAATKACVEREIFLSQTEKIQGMFDRVFLRVDIWRNFETFYKEEGQPKLYDSAYQMDCGLRAIVFGGLWGGDHRYFVYLPVAESDMIFPMTVQIFGLVASLLLVIAFWIYAYVGFHTAIETRNPLNKALLFGFSACLFLRACSQIAGSVGLLPLAGMPMPFMSSAGSSLLGCACMAGMLLRQHQINLKESGNHSHISSPERRRFLWSH